MDDSPKVSRRVVLASAAGLTAAHTLAHEDPPVAGDNRSPRIRHLELLTAAPLPEMRRFYRDTLGLQVADEGTDRLTIRAGATTMSFKTAPAMLGRPFYHFAFNIPENKIAAAHGWQRERTPLMPIPEGLRDPSFPDDVVNYSHWNAHSIFFFDPAENVVEYIARHDMRNGAKVGFSPSDILYASEIAFVVDDVPAAASVIMKSAGLKQYRGGGEEFMAVGDEQGLLLLMKRGRMISFDAKPVKNVRVFQTGVTIQGPRSSEFVHPKYPYRLNVEE